MKKFTIKFIIFVFIIAFIAFNCWGGDSGDDDNNNMLALLQSLNPTLDHTIRLGLTALSSISNHTESVGLESKKFRSLLTRQASSRDSNCSDSGDPIQNDGITAMTGSEDHFPAKTIYCASAFNTYSPDSSLGAMSIASGILCSIGSAGYMDDFEAVPTNTHTITVNFNEACFGSGASQIAAEIGSDSMVVEFTLYDLTGNSSTTGWDYKIVYQAPGEASENLFLRFDSDYAAAKGTDWVFTLDRNNGVLRYVIISQNRRIVLHISGTVGVDGSFASITALKALYLQHATAPNWSYLATLNGTAADGYIGSRYDSGVSQPVVDSACTPASASCSGVTGITLTQSEIDTLANYTDASITSFLSEGELLNFDDVTEFVPSNGTLR